MSDDLIHDRGQIRAGWDDDDPDVTRIVRRVGAALNSGKDKAVVDVVLDEVKRATHPEGRDAEIARRLEWATGRNGHTTLQQIRTEGLDVVIVTPEQEES